MKATLPNLKKLAGRGKVAPAGNSEPLEPEDIEPTEAVEPKPPAAPVPCSSCCPTWRTTARCGWTG